MAKKYLVKQRSLNAFQNKFLVSSDPRINNDWIDFSGKNIPHIEAGKGINITDSIIFEIEEKGTLSGSEITTSHIFKVTHYDDFSHALVLMPQDKNAPSMEKTKIGFNG